MAWWLRLVIGIVLVVGLAGGGVNANPGWLGVVINLLLGLLAAWLVLTGLTMRVGQGRANVR